MKNWELYLVTEEKLSARRSTLEVVEEAVAGGVDVVQLREKNLNMRKRYQLGRKLRQVTEKAGVDLIVNDDADLALALGADGVHLGDDDLPIEVVREILGRDKIIGYSVSTVEELKEAQRNGADYVGCGAVYTTSSKNVASRRQKIGLKNLRQVVNEAQIPVAAIGGIDESNIKEVIKTGADTAAMISSITQADDIEAEVRKLKKRLA